MAHAATIKGLNDKLSFEKKDEATVQSKQHDVMNRRNRNKTFVNLPSLPWKSEISEAIHLAQLGLTAGRQADEIQVNFDFF